MVERTAHRSPQTPLHAARKLYYGRMLRLLTAYAAKHPGWLMKIDRVPADIVEIIVAILLPPLGVFLATGAHQCCGPTHMQSRLSSRRLSPALFWLSNRGCQAFSST
mmetsp:Transcript_12604/g.37920  ORF Transcript_12604/g.37920 Transcript_12604/m.37920 type:complete len:107 (-) Transcript_12604:41-361(-)